MVVRRKDVGCLAIGVLAWGGAMVLGALFGAMPGRALPAMLSGTVLIAIGLAVVTKYRRLGVTANEQPVEPRPVASTTGAKPSHRTEFSLVVIVSEPSGVSVLDEQLQERAASLIAAAPHYPLTPDAEIKTVHVERLPAQTREAVTPAVWALQQQFERRGRAWEVDFHEALGQSFLVAYIE